MDRLDRSRTVVARDQACGVPQAGNGGWFIHEVCMQGLDVLKQFGVDLPLVVAMVNILTSVNSASADERL